MSAPPVIVISKVTAIPPNSSYYSAAAEFPNSPVLAGLMRFVIYPWAYATGTQLANFQTPPQ